MYGSGVIPLREDKSEWSFINKIYSHHSSLKDIVDSINKRGNYKITPLM